jgi:predicted transcriptional regulator
MKEHKSRRVEADAQGEADGPQQAADVRIISDRRLADILTDPQALRRLDPFLGRESSVSDAARLTGEKPNTVLSRVRRFVKLGLLEHSRSVPRKGRAIKLYRTSADAFFIPFDTTSAESLEAGLAERDRYWEQMLRRNVVRARQQQVGSWGTRIYRDARGVLQIQMAVSPDRNHTNLEPDGPAVLSAWRDSVFLDFEDAKRLQHELFELLLRYQRLGGAQRYIVRLGLAPIEEKA